MLKSALLAAVGIAAIAALPAEAATVKNCVSLNGITLNGITLNGEQLHNLSDGATTGAAFKAVRLALPDGTELTFR